MAHTMPDEQFDAVVACHLRAPFRVCRAAAAHMREAAKAEKLAGEEPRDRCVVNVSSTSGLHGNVGQVNYAAAKAGILGLTKTFAKEWGPLGIRCNAVAFGMISTRMTGDAAAHGETVVVTPGVVVPQGLPPGAAALWKDPRAVAGLIPLARAGTPEEAAGGVLLLASPFATHHGPHPRGHRRHGDLEQRARAPARVRRAAVAYARRWFHGRARPGRQARRAAAVEARAQPRRLGRGRWRCRAAAPRSSPGRPPRSR